MEAIPTWWSVCCPRGARCQGPTENALRVQEGLLLHHRRTGEEMRTRNELWQRWWEVPPIQRLRREVPPQHTDGERAAARPEACLCRFQHGARADVVISNYQAYFEIFTEMNEENGPSSRTIYWIAARTASSIGRKKGPGGHHLGPLGDPVPEATST